MSTTMMTPVMGQTGLERVRFFPGQILTADDMSLGSEWVMEKLRRHNRYLHGWGIVCGCDVKPPRASDSAWTLHICPGYLITPQGDEILIASAATFDLAGCILSSADPCAMARPCPPITRRSTSLSQVVYLAVRYVECDARPVRIAPAGCSCGDGQCDYSRVREAYEFCCLDSLPPAQAPYGCDHLCQGDVLPCPDCPPEGWVVLATIALPANVDTMITRIDHGDRRLLYSAAMLREMAICNCATQLPVCATPVINDAGTAQDGVGEMVDITDSTPNSTIYYTVGGAVPDPTNPAQKYSGDFEVSTFDLNGMATIKAIAVAPGYQQSQMASLQIHTSVTPTCADPVINDRGTALDNEGEMVDITDATPNSTIYYTVDGTIPSPNNPAQKYAGEFEVTSWVNSFATVNAIAVAPGYQQSAMSSLVVRHP